MNDVLDREIRAALGDLLDTAPLPPLPLPHVAPEARDASPRRALAVAAAALAGVGVLGLIATAGRDTERAPAPGTPPEVPSVGPSLVPMPPVTTAPSAETVPPAYDPTQVQGIFLPTVLPAGYRVGDVSVLAMETDDSVVNAHYVRKADGGSEVGAAVTLRVGPIPEGIERTDDADRIVHGLPAFVFDSGEGIVATWQENGVQATVRGIGLTDAEVVEVAERTVVTGGDDPLIALGEPPAGFEISITDAAPGFDAVSSTLQLLPVDGAPGGFIDVSAYINDDQATLEVLAAQYSLLEGTTERVTVGDREALLYTSPTDSLGTMAWVTWTEGASIVSVQGRLEREALLGIAATVAPASIDDARALRDSMDTALVGLDELDRAVLPSGIEVSVRGGPNGAVGLCVHAPVERCQGYVTEAALAGEYQDVASATFWIDGRPTAVAWAAGDHTPQQQLLDGASTPVADVAAGEVGTFLTGPIDETDGFTWKFDPDADAIYSLSPGQDDLLDTP